MYQPNPSAGQTPGPLQPAPAPAPVLTAVKLMYAGAVVSAITFVIGLLTVGTTRTTLKKAYPKYTAHQISALVTVDVVIGIVVGLLSIGLWLWLARACNRGRNWARITGTVLFGLDTLLILLSVSRLKAGVGVLVDLVIWLIGLAAVVLLWRKESSAYFASQPRV
jgi:NADH:ubiquinone oxidoreductase subunit 6 (subunit J)